MGGFCAGVTVWLKTHFNFLSPPLFVMLPATYPTYPPVYFLCFFIFPYINQNPQNTKNTNTFHDQSKIFFIANHKNEKYQIKSFLICYATKDPYIQFSQETTNKIATTLLTCLFGHFKIIFSDKPDIKLHTIFLADLWKLKTWSAINAWPCQKTRAFNYQ